MPGVTKNYSLTDCSLDGLKTKVATNNVNDTTPTAAELITSFGAASAVGAGFVGVVNDNAGGTNFYIVATDGTSYFYLKMTKAL